MTSDTIRIPRPAYTSRWLFHRPAFLQSGHEGTLRSFYQYTDQKVTAAMHCLITGPTAHTAAEGFYGSLELDTVADPDRFMSYVSDELASAGVDRLAVTLFPEEYDPESWRRQRTFFEDHAFRREGMITHRLVAVTNEDDEPLAGNDWRSGDINLPDFSVTQEPLDQYDKIMRLIQRSDVQNGSNGHDQSVSSCMAAFPEKVYLFAVREGAKYCALGVFLEVGPGILYTLHLAQLEQSEERKPLVALFQFVYEWAELQDLRYIDLGQIGLNLKEDIGLIQASGERWVKSW